MILELKSCSTGAIVEAALPKQNGPNLKDKAVTSFYAHTKGWHQCAARVAINAGFGKDRTVIIVVERTEMWTTTFRSF